MTTRHVVRTAAASLLTVGLVALGATSGRAQNTTAVPEKGGPITMVGCFTTGVIGKSSHERFVLAKPIVGSVASVPDATCTASGSDQMIKLQDLKQVHLGNAQLGRWVEINGRLEGNHRADAIREVHVKSFSLVPVVVPPPPVAAVTQPEPQAFVETPAPAAPIVEAAPAPVPTAGVTDERKKLPKTATSLPLVGLIGVMSLAAALLLRAAGRSMNPA